MSDAPNRSRAHSEPLPPSPAAGSTSPVKVQAPPLAAVGPSLSQKWFPFLASSPATTTSSSPTAAAQFAVPAGSSRDSGREKVTETIQEASESEEGSSPTRMVMKAPQRPLKNRAPRPLDIQTSPNSETPSETKSHLSESLTSRSPTRKSPLTAAVVPDEARTPQAPDCVCHEVVNESDPKSCKKCCGYLPCIGRYRTIFMEALFLCVTNWNYDRLETQIQQSAHDLDKAKRRMDVLTIRAEQAEETSRSFKQQTDTLSQEIQRKEAEIQVMRTDLDTIGEKLVDELERRAELQHSKDAVQEELEELTRSLFEEANSMVASEARERHRFEEREVSLKKQMEQMKLQLTMEQAQLRELKLRMEQVTLENAQLKKGQRPVLAKSPTSGSLPLTHQHQSNIEALYTAAIDSLDLNELSLFDEFIDTSPNTKLNKLHSIPFLKLCLDEDVAPCLRFSAAPKIQGRKLVEPILLNACYVEELSAGQLKGLNERDEKWEEQNSGAKLGVIGDDGARQAISPNPEDSHLDESALRFVLL